MSDSKKPAGGRGGAFGRRSLKERVLTKGKRTVSSARWLERQLNDPYVAEARAKGLRSRAAFKIMQMDEKYHFLKPGSRVVDLGAAPGGWCQFAVDKVGPKGKVVGIDLLPVDPLPGVEMLEGDFLDPAMEQRLRDLLGGGADVVLSDMAASATGHAKTDHLKIMGLFEVALDFAESVLTPGGVFLAKVLRGGTESALLARLKRNFGKVAHVKPPASRADSRELYVIALGFKGQNS